LRHWMGPRVQAMPGMEQATAPPGWRAQTTHPSVHSAQTGRGVPAELRASKAPTVESTAMRTGERRDDGEGIAAGRAVHPNTRRPARPPEPTMIRHQAKGV
jgi:hypothetical protein